jgi:hypothetical protein
MLKIAPPLHQEERKACLSHDLTRIDASVLLQETLRYIELQEAGSEHDEECWRVAILQSLGRHVQRCGHALDLDDANIGINILWRYLRGIEEQTMSIGLQTATLREKIITAVSTLSEEGASLCQDEFTHVAGRYPQIRGFPSPFIVEGDAQGEITVVPQLEVIAACKEERSQRTKKVPHCPASGALECVTRSIFDVRSLLQNRFAQRVPVEGAGRHL